ncbi:MAG: hypothetical protein LBM93_16010 [Oscillospiraceae bacterium]|jgi:GTPase SAR1 family protein|nr:hypothetical protein [Oscillospiraceae bacterium]
MNTVLSTALLYILIAVIITSFLRALFTYGYAVWKNSIKNAASYLWHEAHPEEELYRNYFFGPWRHQIKLIYIDCREIITLEPNFTGTSWLQEKISEVNISKIPVIVRFFIIVPMFWVWFFIYVYHYFERFFSVIFTALILSVCTLAHTMVAIPVSFFGKLFVNVQKAKEVELRVRNNRAIRCTHCLEESTDCYFRCPQCQRVHKNLHPSRHGIWNTRCDCGYKLPLTHKGRQLNLSVHEVCPLCGNDLLFAMSKNFGIQLIGGSSAGKTTFLAAFLHEYISKLEAFPYNSLRYYTVPGEKFDELEFCFKTGTSNATSERSALTYTISHELPDSDTMLNFSIYDIAGEVFANSSYDRTQNQYTYCEGLVVLVDPLTSLDFRQRIGFEENELQGFSQSSPYIILSSFLETYKNLNRFRKNLVNVPLSVIITKSDISAINEKIGLDRIQQLYSEQEYAYGFKFENARDTICKEFLFDIDFSDFLQLIDANFKNVHYFPATAIGHTLDGTEYRPQGILEGVEWLLSADLKNMIEKARKFKSSDTSPEKTKKVEYVKPVIKPENVFKPIEKKELVISQADIEKELKDEEIFKTPVVKKTQRQEIDIDEFFAIKKPKAPVEEKVVSEEKKPKIKDNVIFFDEPLEEYKEEEKQTEKYIAPATYAPKPIIADNEIFFDEPLEEYKKEEKQTEKYIAPATYAPKPIIADNEIFFDEPLEEYKQEEKQPEKYVAPVTNAKKFDASSNEVFLDEELEEYIPPKKEEVPYSTPFADGGYAELPPQIIQQSGFFEITEEKEIITVQTKSNSLSKESGFFEKPPEVTFVEIPKSNVVEDTEEDEDGLDELVAKYAQFYEDNPVESAEVPAPIKIPSSIKKSNSLDLDDFISQLNNK